MFSCDLCGAGSREECKCAPKDVELYALRAEVKMLVGAIEGWRNSGKEKDDELAALRRELISAQNYAAEIALGIAHYTHGDGEICIRCERDVAKATGAWLAGAAKAFRRYYEYTPHANGMTQEDQDMALRLNYLMMIEAAEKILPDLPAQEK